MCASANNNEHIDPHSHIQQTATMIIIIIIIIMKSHCTCGYVCYCVLNANWLIIINGALCDKQNITHAQMKHQQMTYSYRWFIARDTLHWQPNNNNNKTTYWYYL